MTNLFRRAVVAGVALFTLGLAPGCGGGPEPVTPKAQDGDKQFRPVRSQMNSGGAAPGGGAKQPGGKARTTSTVSPN
jgi:hypothetical protein